MRIILATVICLALLCQTAEAARGFGTTYGAGATDAVSSPFNVTLNSKTSYSIWTVFNGSGGGGGFGTLFNAANGATNTVVFAANNNSTTIQFLYARSTTAGDWTFPINTGSNWQHVCLSYDSSSTSNTPTIYVNGSSVTATNVSSPVGTALTANTIAGVSKIGSGANLWDGKIAEVAVWSGVTLSANQCSALYKGASAPQIAPASLVYYLPLYGGTSGERDWGSSRFTQTVTGTLSQPHPRIRQFNQWGQ